MKYRVLFASVLSAVSLQSLAFAACPAAPVASASDPVLQLRNNADSKAGFGAAGTLDSTEEGAIVWDDTLNRLSYCNGTSWVSLTAGGADNLGNHTASQTLDMNGNDIGDIGTATADAMVVTTSTGLQWEGGVNRITHNDGGGNVQIRFGNEYDSGSERFTHGGGAADISANIDSTSGTQLDLVVSSNAGAGAGQPVSWGSVFRITEDDVTFGGTSLLPIANPDAGTLDGLDSAQFLRSDADDVTTGNLGFSSGNGRGLRFWNSDSYKIYMSSTGDATWGGALGGGSDYNMYFRMNGGSNRGFVFQNGTNEVAHIDGSGNTYLAGDLTMMGNELYAVNFLSLVNNEPTALALDGDVGFDSSRGLIIYRTQQIGDQSGNGVYTVLDTSNIAAGSGIVLSNTATNESGSAAITISTDGNADTVDSLHASSFIRSDANDNVTAHTEWQDGQQVRFGADADYRLWHDGTNMYMRGYRHGARLYVQGEDAGGTNRQILMGDPDNSLELYYAGSKKAETVSEGLRVYKGLDVVASSSGSPSGFAYVELNDTGGNPMVRMQTENGSNDDYVYFKVFDDSNNERHSLWLERSTGAVFASGGDLILNKNGNGGNVSNGPDIFMTNHALVAAESDWQINVDSDNNGSGGLEVYKGSETSSGRTSLFSVANNGNLTLPSGSASKPGGGSWSSTSDARLKNIDGTYDKGLSEIIALKPVMFHYKEDNARNMPSDKQEYGFIAQDVQDVFPEAVEEGEDGYLSLNLHTVHVATVNALKELAEKNESLVSENAKLWDALKKQQEEIDALKASMQ